MEIVMRNPRNWIRAWAIAGCFLGTVAVSAQEYRVMVTGAVIAATRDVAGTARPWDAAGGRPDPYVVVELAGEPVFVSGKQQDTLQPRWFTGTSAWPLRESTPVRIVVRDADLGKGLARVGAAGVSLRPDVPNAGKRIVNDVLLGVDSDDVVAVWRGTLGQLIKALGGANRSGRLIPGRQLRFEVYDKDGASDDLVGTLLTAIPGKPGRQVQRGGQVTALALRFQ